MFRRRTRRRARGVGGAAISGSGPRFDISLEAFSKVVEDIYDCALDPRRWHKTVRDIAALIDSPRCTLGVHDFANGCNELMFQVGWEDQHYWRLHEEKYSGMSPFFPSLRMTNTGDVVTQRMVLTDEEFMDTKYYQEWAKPQGLHDMIAIKALQTGQRIGLLVANREQFQPRYGDAEVRLLTLLSPHVCRAVAISDTLSLKTVTSDALEATLDAISSGVYLTDTHARVVHMNSSAERQIRVGNTLRIEHSRLVAVDPAARSALTRAIAEAIKDATETSFGGVTLALPGRDGAGLVATILQLDRGERRNLCRAFPATVAVFVQDPVVVPPFPGEAFAKLHGLTGGELRVLLVMAPGLSVKEAAEMLGISEATAKTHLQRIFSKTGTSKQTELMHLFMSSAPPVRAG